MFQCLNSAFSSTRYSKACVCYAFAQMTPRWNTPHVLLGRYCNSLTLTFGRRARVSLCGRDARERGSGPGAGPQPHAVLVQGVQERQPARCTTGHRDTDSPPALHEPWRIRSGLCEGWWCFSLEWIGLFLVFFQRCCSLSSDFAPDDSVLLPQQIKLKQCSWTKAWYCKRYKPFCWNRIGAFFWHLWLTHCFVDTLG